MKTKVYIHTSSLDLNSEDGSVPVHTCSKCTCAKKKPGDSFQKWATAFPKNSSKFTTRNRVARVSFSKVVRLYVRGDALIKKLVQEALDSRKATG
ncbi:MAG: hypothetical protein COV91_04140 [Candidatus Taylorbacteria bacterium CG11_big_fil_rev_8_21_14_0_20_46_11]|uniref:Uncharacterized protein n=1 Tax=Candidatus Taylorbacteria bacterium CG11_big_fil_rev_8_21_14_0_20_46_11 TaxID=1975025 RepID=A0A2H0KAZ0_9BACT|nr:MAG: hypothetical protein COV91_04140 [Candidatus Taylorbacteria bacterium CG11_big_fil_rev_8_21_14_0_20_46_11]